MLNYDNTLLADTLWTEHIRVVKENVILKTELEVAKKVIQSLQNELADRPSAEESVELSEHG